MSQFIAVTSGKGGVGKSTVSVGLAFALCRKGKRVLLVDMDEGLRCLDLLLGVDRTAVFDLADILRGKELEEAVYPVPGQNTLFLIPAPDRVGMIDPFNFANFVKSVDGQYDTVLFDFPAGLDFTLYTCLPQDALFLTVATADPVSVRDAAAVSARLDELGLSSRLLLNRFRFRLSKKGVFHNIDQVIDGAGLQLIGIIPESEELGFLSVQHTLKPHGKSLAAFLRTASRLCGEPVLLPNPKKI